jgi:hypothetical protein
MYRNYLQNLGRSNSYNNMSYHHHRHNHNHSDTYIPSQYDYHHYHYGNRDRNHLDFKNYYLGDRSDRHHYDKDDIDTIWMNDYDDNQYQYPDPDQDHNDNDFISRLEEFLSKNQNNPQTWILMYMQKCGHCQNLMDECHIDHQLPTEHLNNLYNTSKSTFFISSEDLEQNEEMINQSPYFSKIFEGIDTVPQLFKCFGGKMILQPPENREEFIRLWN